MCCFNLPSRGSASSCIWGCASAAFSHARGGCTVVHPPSASATTKLSHSARRRMRIPLSSSSQQRSYRAFTRGSAFVEKSRFDRNHFSVAVDEIRARHARNVVGKWCLAFRVVDHGETRGVGLQESICIRPLLVRVDCHDRKAAVPVTVLHLVHPGKGAAARTTPRGPEIDVDNATAQSLEHHWLTACRRQRKPGGGVSHANRGCRRRPQCEQPGRAGETQVPRAPCPYWHTVPGGVNTCRVMAFVCDTPLTV